MKSSRNCLLARSQPDRVPVAMAVQASGGGDAGPCSVMLLSDFAQYATDAQLLTGGRNCVLDRQLASFLVCAHRCQPLARVGDD